MSVRRKYTTQDREPKKDTNMSNNIFKKLAIATAGATIAFAAVDASSAQAGTLTYNFVGSSDTYAPSFSFTTSGVSLTATASSTAPDNKVSYSAIGLGVNAFAPRIPPTTTNLAVPAIYDINPRQIDGNQWDETLWLDFGGQTVRLISATFGNVNVNDDLDLLVNGSTSLLHTNIQLNSTSSGLTKFVNFTSLLSASAATGTNFGFRATDDNDKFALLNATFEIVSVPEPTATLGLLAVGAFGAAALKRKQK